MVAKHNLIVKHNDLILASFDMTLQQYKFTLYMISKIQKDDEDFHDIYITVSEFAKITGSSSKRMFEYMKDFRKSLARKTLDIEFKNNNGKSIPWFSEVDYISNSGYVKACFNEKIKPYLLQLKSNFTAYLFNNIKHMNSIYAIRLYELIKKEQYKQSVEFDVDSLKSYLCIPNEEYKLFGDFNRRVIKQGVKEINSKTDIVVDYELIKDNKKVVSILFTISKKSNDTVKLQEYKELNKTKTKNKQNKNTNAKNIGNFDQREYSDEFYQSLYDNM